MLFYVLSIIFYQSTIHIFPHDKIVKIADFGFRKNGNFSFRYIPEVSNFTIFMLSKEFTGFFKSSYLSSLKICNGTFPEKPYFNHSIKSVGGGGGLITGTVNESQVLVAFIANCGSRQQLTMSVQFLNRDSALDSRDSSAPQVFLILSFIYPCISILWIANSFIYPKFHVQLHTALSFSAAIKALSLYYGAKVWYTMALLDKCSMSLHLISELFFVLAHSYLFTVNALAVSGWGTYREKVRFDQIINISLVTIWFFISIALSHVATYAFFLIPLFSMALFVGCIFAQMIYSDLVSAIHLYPLTSSQNYSTILVMKLNIVINFGASLTIWAAVFGFVLIYFLVGTVESSFRRITYELFILSIYLIDIYFFFFKKGYEPFSLQTEEVDKEPEPDKQELVLLKEPNEEWYSFLDKHRFSTI